MRTDRGMRGVALLLAVLLVFGLLPPAQLTAAASADTPHTLTKTMKAGVKTVVNEVTSEGTRLGAVVRLYNGGARAAVVPDYELRAVTSDSSVYTLKPSADNPQLVQSKETIELSYMLTVRRTDKFSLSRISWVSVDEYVYPKKETTLLTVPVAALVWHGHATAFADAQRLKAWGTAFTIPTASDALLFTPVRLWQKETPQGVTDVLVLEVQNTGRQPAWLPAFTVTGKTTAGYFRAERIESGEISLAPEASTYLHYVLKLPAKQPWKSFTIATPESFADADRRIDYEAGRVQIQAPKDGSSTQAVQAVYRFLSPIRIQSTIHPELAADVEISLAELHQFEQSGDGYQTAVAKFRLINRSNAPLPLPAFDAEWKSPSGVSYLGERMDTAQQQLMPGVGMMLYYAFTVPAAASRNDRAVITLLDDGGSGIHVPIGAVRSGVSPDAPAADTAVLYPFTLQVKDWSVKRPTERGDQNVDLTLDLNIERESNVSFDEKSVRLKVELADPSGRVIGARYYPLAGPNRLSGGLQTITFNAGRDVPQSFELRLYEVFAAPSGDVERRVLTRSRIV